MSQISASRRLFLQQLAASAAVVTAGLGLSGCDDEVGATFDHGVASGDPQDDGVILWTRITPAAAATLKIDWEVASDASFSSVVTKGSFVTSAARDYTVKVDVQGLQPDTAYFYRFKRGETVSPVGRTRTLPVGAVDQVKLGVFSCANFPAGYFHVYAEAAKRDDLHAVVHLGDYIYEYEKDGYASQDAVALGRVSLPAGELLTVSDYRARYAQYRGDKDLQALHAALPFICVWDDHEIANDGYENGAENHNATTEGDYNLRRAAALQAYYEWLPIREQDPANPLRIYRSFDFGDLMSLHMLDTRHIGRDAQLAYANYIDPTTGAFDAASFQADMAHPDRQLLGIEQTQWLQGQLAASTATWQVLGQQVLMGKMYLPSPLLTPDPTHPTVTFAEYAVIATAFGTYQYIAAQLAAAGNTNPTPTDFLNAGMTAEQLTIVNDPAMQAIISAPSIPYNLDAWDGYAVARETVLGTALALDKNLVVISGDTHNAWANDLKDLSGNQVGVEFATSSVSSPGLEEYLPGEDPLTLAAGVQQLIPTLKYANTYQRGYMVLSMTAQEARADWYVVDTIKSTVYSMTLDRSLRTLPGAGNRNLVAV
ncbi:MAG: alkaline phosphatase [Halothiobacillaceae bacterium]|nr:MAG: alkaline phosphatase [Halothiobacillaceae bacterium]